MNNKLKSLFLWAIKNLWKMVYFAGGSLAAMISSFIVATVKPEWASVAETIGLICVVGWISVPVIWMLVQKKFKSVVKDDDGNPRGLRWNDLEGEAEEFKRQAGW